MHDSWLSPKVRVAPSPVHGRGIFAAADIAQGERILVWGGVSYTDESGAEEARRQGRGVMQWDDDVFSVEVDGEDGQEPFRINHSCDPNAWMAGAFTIIARRQIGQGEEVTTDYALWESDETSVAPWPCACGSRLCRGRITGVDWRDLALQERYRGHFSPLLNGRIERVGGGSRQVC